MSSEIKKKFPGGRGSTNFMVISEIYKVHTQEFLRRI